MEFTALAACQILFARMGKQEINLEWPKLLICRNNNGSYIRYQSKKVMYRNKSPLLLTLDRNVITITIQYFVK